MGRLGITYEDVLSSIKRLKAKNKNITIENIRKDLGSGSSGTVNKHLQRYRSLNMSNDLSNLSKGRDLEKKMESVQFRNGFNEAIRLLKIFISMNKY